MPISATIVTATPAAIETSGCHQRNPGERSSCGYGRGSPTGARKPNGRRGGGAQGCP
jgi:hypothetical protein